MGRRAAGAGLMAVGLTCGYVALWIVAFMFPMPFGSPDSYWQMGPTLGWWLLAVLALTTLLALLAVSSTPRAFAVGAAAAGAVATGGFLFYPVLLGFHDDWVRAGAYLGLCTILAPVGAMLLAGGTAPRSLERVGFVLAVGGLVAVFAAVWLDFDGAGTYWNLRPFGHRVGISLLSMVAVGAALVLAAQLWRLPMELPAVLAALLVGFTFLFPVAHTEDFGQLGAGAWAAGAGALAFLVGTSLPRRRGAASPAEAVVDAEHPSS